MKLWNALLLLALPLAVAAPGRSVPPPPGPHGGIVATDGPSRAEVKVDRALGRVDVYLLDSPGGAGAGTAPTLELFTEAGSGGRIELRAVDPSGALPHFQGPLSDQARRASEPMVGFELRFGLDSRSIRWLGAGFPRLPKPLR